MEELVQLIIFAIVVLLSTAFGRTKKPARGAKPPMRRPPVGPPPVAQRPSQPAPKKPESFREFFELLQQQAEAVMQEEPTAVVEEPPPIRVARPPVVRTPRPEPKTVETLVPAGGASHEKFHKEFIRPLELPKRRVPPHFVLPLDPVSLKRAVIWSEILGSPKGMEE
jgi:hypothetical protein